MLCACWMPAKSQHGRSVCVGLNGKDERWQWRHTHTYSQRQRRSWFPFVRARKSSPSCIGHPAPTRRSIEAEIMAAFATNRACKVMSLLPTDRPIDRPHASAFFAMPCVWCNNCASQPKTANFSHCVSINVSVTATVALPRSACACGLCIYVSIAGHQYWCHLQLASGPRHVNIWQFSASLGNHFVKRSPLHISCKTIKKENRAAVRMFILGSRRHRARATTATCCFHFIKLSTLCVLSWIFEERKAATSYIFLIFSFFYFLFGLFSCSVAWSQMSRLCASKYIFNLNGYIP